MALGFTLDAEGADKVSGGIKSLFDSLGKAGLVRQQAEQLTGLRNAQIYHHSMSGNKAGAEAESEQFTLGKRKTVPEQIAADPNMPDYRRAMLHAFGLTGDTNVERVAKAGGEFQSQGIRDKAVASVDDLDRMNRFNTLAKPGDTYMPFDNIGNTGTVFNKATGAGSVASAALEKLFSDESTSKAKENNAQADNAAAGADRNRASTEFIKAKSSIVGINGKPLTASQLRQNADIEEAREQLANMNETDVAAVMKENPSFMNGQQRQTFDLIKRAQKAKFGEDSVPQTKPQPALPKPEKAGLLDTVAKIFKPGAAKSPAPAPGATKMDAQTVNASITRARAAIANGAPRDAVIKRLTDNGIDPTGL